MTESALVRLLLNPRVTGRAFAPGAVLQIVSSLGQDPRWRWLPDDSSLSRPVIDTAVLSGHQQVTDLHLVNLAARADLVLVTFDAGIQAGLAPGDRRHVRLLEQQVGQCEGLAGPGARSTRSSRSMSTPRSERLATAQAAGRLGPSSPVRRGG